MAPEMFEDARCPRTVKYDVYSFGILLWELLSEKTPFENGTDIGSLFAGKIRIYSSVQRCSSVVERQSLTGELSLTCA